MIPTRGQPGPSGPRRFLPILRWLPAYDRSLIRFDVIAGATVWGLLVPEMIAYASLAGLPRTGLYTLLATLAAYALFASSRHLVVAGTSAAAVLLASSVGPLAHDQASYTANAAALALLVRRAVIALHLRIHPHRDPHETTPTAPGAPLRVPNRVPAWLQ